MTSVTFGKADAADFTVDSPTKITAKTPAGAAGVTDVRVTTLSGASPIITGDHYIFEAVSPTPPGSTTPRTTPPVGGNPGGGLPAIGGGQHPAAVLNQSTTQGGSSESANPGLPSLFDGASLAFTGGVHLNLAVLALGLIAVGSVTLLASKSRRRRWAHATRRAPA